MTFDESQSWYYQKNIEMMQRKSRRRMMMKQPHFDGIVKFHSKVLNKKKKEAQFVDQIY